jgi:hypothetical protein
MRYPQDSRVTARFKLTEADRVAIDRRLDTIEIRITNNKETGKPITITALKVLHDECHRLNRISAARGGDELALLELYTLVFNVTGPLAMSQHTQAMQERWDRGEREPPDPPPPLAIVWRAMVEAMMTARRAAAKQRLEAEEQVGEAPDPSPDPSPTPQATKPARARRARKKDAVKKRLLPDAEIHTLIRQVINEAVPRLVNRQDVRDRILGKDDAPGLRPEARQTDIDRCFQDDRYNGRVIRVR